MIFNEIVTHCIKFHVSSLRNVPNLLATLSVGLFEEKCVFIYIGVPIIGIILHDNYLLSNIVCSIFQT